MEDSSRSNELTFPISALGGIIFRTKVEQLLEFEFDPKDIEAKLRLEEPFNRRRHSDVVTLIKWSLREGLSCKWIHDNIVISSEKKEFEFLVRKYNVQDYTSPHTSEISLERIQLTFPFLCRDVYDRLATNNPSSSGDLDVKFGSFLSAPLFMSSLRSYLKWTLWVKQYVKTDSVIATSEYDILKRGEILFNSIVPPLDTLKSWLELPENKLCVYESD